MIPEPMPTIPQAPDTTAPSGNPRPEPPHLSRRQFVARNMALLGTVILTQGNEEANNLEVTHHRIAMPHLRAPTRLVQLTDLHRSWCVSEGFIARIVTQTNALHPDLILLTGDFVTGSSRFVYSCVKQLGRLHAPLGMYGVLGNHDYWCDNNQGALAVAESLETVDIRLLMNTST